MLTAGVDIRTVARRLGHRNASTTLDDARRLQPLPRVVRQGADVLGRIVDNAIAPSKS